MKQSLALLWKYVKRHRARIALLTCVYVTSTTVFVLAPQALSYFIDSVHENRSRNIVFLAIALYVGAVLVRKIMSSLLTAQLSDVGQQITDDYRRDVMEHFLSLDLRHLSRWTSGEAITRLDEDVKGLFEYYFIFFFKLSGSGLALLGILAALIFRSGWLCGALLLISMLSILGFKAIQDRGIAKYVRRAAATAALNGVMKEMLDNAATLRALRAEKYVDTRVKNAMAKWLHESFPASLMYGNLWSASTIMQGAVMASGLLAAMLFRDACLVTLGTAYLIYTYSEMVIGPLQDFRNHMGEMQGAKAGIMRTQELLNLPLLNNTGKLFLSDEAPALEINGLSFAYGNGPQVLRDIALSVPAGFRLGIMGETGCGKSTLMSLIACLNPYETGSIRIQGKELRQIRQQCLRERVALCTQRVQIIHGTLRDNITFYERRYTDADIHRAIKRLRLTEWFEKFPAGLNAHLVLGEGNISSGEGRLISLIRLALVRPRLVLLDEMTANLDEATQRRMTEAMKALCEGCTVIAIAHHPAALDWMDAIVQMKDGALIPSSLGGIAVCE